MIVEPSVSPAASVHYVFSPERLRRRPRCRAPFALMVLIGSDSGMVSISHRKWGDRHSEITEMLFFLLMPWILFNIFTSSPLLARNRATS